MPKTISIPIVADHAAIAKAPVPNPAAVLSDGLGCHSGKEQMLSAAKEAGKTETLERYAVDYPKGPHDQPQSMCPAFGSLRVGLRMDRLTNILKELSGYKCFRIEWDISNASSRAIEM